MHPMIWISLICTYRIQLVWLSITNLEGIFNVDP
jgi:hypothetical protein